MILFYNSTFGSNTWQIIYLHLYFFFICKLRDITQPISAKPHKLILICILLHLYYGNTRYKSVNEDWPIWIYYFSCFLCFSIFTFRIIFVAVNFYSMIIYIRPKRTSNSEHITKALFYSLVQHADKVFLMRWKRVILAKFVKKC